jgi:hypothetical protein
MWTFIKQLPAKKLKPTVMRMRSSIRAIDFGTKGIMSSCSKPIQARTDLFGIVAVHLSQILR